MNQLENKQRTLAQMLAANRLTKIASDQEIEHKDVTSQSGLGKEQEQEVRESIGGVAASSPAAANKPKDTVDTPPNCQNLNKDPQAALAATGTDINVVEQDGTPTQLKSAADYKAELAYMLAAMNKKAAMQKQAAEKFNEDFRTGTEVMQKLASLTPNSTQEELDHCADELMKLASTNPMFQVCRDRILMQKLAEDVEALAEAQGISPDEAAAALDEAAAADPSIMQDAEDEATGEAVADLANAEEETGALMEGVQQLADNASQNLGVEVTPDDILDAIDEVEAKAEEMGVPPEALIEAAMQEMQGGDDVEVTPEDEANAEAIMEEAAANGVSPDEVLQMAAEELGGGEGAPAEAAPETAETEATTEAAPETAPAEKPKEGEEKQASVRVAATPRAEYVNQLINRKCG